MSKRGVVGRLRYVVDVSPGEETKWVFTLDCGHKVGRAAWYQDRSRVEVCRDPSCPDQYHICTCGEAVMPARRQCQACIDKLRARRLKEDAVTVSIRQRGYRAKRREHINATHKEYRLRHPLKFMLYCAKRRAAEIGVPFTITLADVVVPDVCPLLGIPIVRGDGKQHAGSPSFDRKDSSLGYVPGNVWVISYRANAIKSNATVDELELIARNLRFALESDRKAARALTFRDAVAELAKRPVHVAAALGYGC